MTTGVSATGKNLLRRLLSNLSIGVVPPMTATTPSIWPTGVDLREARRRAGLTREKLAVLAGCSEAWVAQLEAGVQPLHSVKLAAIWRVLDALGGRSSDGGRSPRRQHGTGGT